MLVHKVQLVLFRFWVAAATFFICWQFLSVCIFNTLLLSIKR